MGFSGDRPQGEPQKDYYFLLTNLTDTGVSGIKASTDGVNRISSMVKSLGGTCHFFLTLGGPYDIISVVEGINDQAARKLVLGINAVGFVRTTLLKAWELYGNEYRKFV